MINLTMRNKILFGVYVIYCIRKLRSPFFAEFFAFIILAIVLTYFVSVPSVLTNMSNSGNFYQYFVIAFSNANFLIQSVLVLVGVTTLFFVRNLTFHAILKIRPA